MRKVKILFVAVIAVVLALAGVACAKAGTLTGISITKQPTNTKFNVGATVDATALAGMEVTAAYDDDTTKVVTEGLTYSPAKVSATTTKITVTYTEGDLKFSAEVPITVLRYAVPATGVTVTAAGLTDNKLNIPNTATLTAEITPANATEKSVTWSSSDETKATVDATGKVTAKATGSVKITATARGVNENAVVAGSIDLTITNDPVNLTGIKLNTTDVTVLLVDGYRTSTVSVTELLPVNYNIDTVEWVVVSGGEFIEALSIAADKMSVTVTAKAEGKAVIAARSVRDNTVKTDVQVSVSEKGTEITSEAQFIEVFYTNYDANRANSFYLTKDLDFSKLDGDDAEGKTYGTGTDGKFTMPSRWGTIAGVGGNKSNSADPSTWRGNNANAFTGILDGQGYTLSNFVIADGGENPAAASADFGLFPQLGVTTAKQADVMAGRNGVLRNIAIVDAEMIAFQRSGFVCALSNGLIDNCYVEGKLINRGAAGYEASAGLCGEIGSDGGAGSSSLGWIQNCVINIDTSESAVDGATGNEGEGISARDWNGGITNYMKAGGHYGNDEEMSADMWTDSTKTNGQFIVNNYVITDTMKHKRICGQASDPGQNTLLTLAELGDTEFFLNSTQWELNADGLPVLKQGVYAGGVAGAIPTEAL